MCKFSSRPIFTVALAYAVTVVPIHGLPVQTKLLRIGGANRRILHPDQYFSYTTDSAVQSFEEIGFSASESEDADMSMSLSMPVVMDPESLEQMLSEILNGMNVPMSMSMNSAVETSLTVDHVMAEQPMACDESIVSNINIMVAVDLAADVNGVPAEPVMVAFDQALADIYQLCDSPDNTSVATTGSIRGRKLQDDGDIIILGGGVVVVPLANRYCPPTAFDAESCTIAVITVPVQDPVPNTRKMLMTSMESILASDDGFDSKVRASGIVGMRIVNDRSGLYGLEEEEEGADLDEGNVGFGNRQTGDEDGDSQKKNTNTIEWDVFLVLFLGVLLPLVALCFLVWAKRSAPDEAKDENEDIEFSDDTESSIAGLDGASNL